MPTIQQNSSIDYNKTSIASIRIFLKDSPSYQQNSTRSITKSVGLRKSSESNSNTTYKRVNLRKPSTSISSTKPLIVYAVRSTLYYNLSARLPPYSNVVLRYRQSNSTIDIPLRLTLSTIHAPLYIITTPVKTATTRKPPITLVALEVISQILSKSSAKKLVSSTLYIRTPMTQASQQMERTLSTLTCTTLLTTSTPLQRMPQRVMTQNARFSIYSRPY